MKHLFVLTLAVLCFTACSQTVGKEKAPEYGSIRFSKANTEIFNILIDINTVIECVERKEFDNTLPILQNYLSLPPNSPIYCEFFGEIKFIMEYMKEFHPDLQEDLYTVYENYDCHCN